MVRRALVLVPGGQVIIMGLGWKHGGGLGSPCIGTCVSAFPLMRRQRETLGRFSAWYWIASNRPWLCDPGKEAQEPMHGSPASFDFGLGRGRQQPDDDMLCSTWGRTKIALSVPAYVIVCPRPSRPVHHRHSTDIGLPSCGMSFLSGE
ncbi:hypothetical protein CMEL01_00762 [Colletotrichum melonis]|uniref:Uncharacterized protein n=1 Tax=Colletotrichum melonis TaxID=1209925 RepID=A0AAI9V445_9PEZI|nr:hypothetical protein CMEL01_00762 [Colletotrichum melonis]